MWNEDTSKEKFLEEYSVDTEGDTWNAALKSYSILPIFSLICILILSFISFQVLKPKHKKGYCTRYLSMVGAAGITSALLMYPMIMTFKAANELEEYAGADIN